MKKQTTQGNKLWEKKPNQNTQKNQTKQKTTQNKKPKQTKQNKAKKQPTCYKVRQGSQVKTQGPHTGVICRPKRSEVSR